MMRRVLLALPLFFASVLLAQAPARVTFTATNVLDSGGSSSLASGNICFATTDINDKPMGYRVGSGSGQSSASPGQAACASVTAGAITPIQIINSAASNPQNACIRVTTFNAANEEIRRNKCVQTGTPGALASWCSQSGGVVTCAWDNYPIGTTPVPLIQVGPTGPQGLPGVISSGQIASAASPLANYSASYGQLATFGQTSYTVDSNAGSFPAIIFPNTPTTTAGTVEQVSVYMGTAGSTTTPAVGTPVNLVFGTYSGNAMTGVASYPVTVKNAGLNTWLAGVDFPPTNVAAGTYFGYGMPTSASSTAYASTGGPGGYSVIGASSINAGSAAFAGLNVGIGANASMTIYQPVTSPVLVPTPSQIALSAQKAATIASSPLANYTGGYGGTDQITGSTSYATNANAGSFPFTIMGPTGSTAAGFVQSVSVSTGSLPVGSPLNLLLATFSGGLFTGIATYPVTTKVVGLNTWLTGQDFPATYAPAGTYVGYGMPTSASAIPYASSGGLGAYSFPSATLPAGATSFGGTNGTVGVNVSMDVAVLSGTPTLVPTPAQISISAARDTNAKQTQLYTTNFASLPSSAVTTASGWSAASDGLTSPSTGQGYGNSLYLQQVYAVDQRTYRYAFEILASGTIVGFGARPDGYDNDNTWGSLCVVNSAAGTLSFLNAWDGGSNTGTAGSAAIPFTLTTGRVYELTLTLNRRQMSATLFDPVTAQSISVSTGSNASDPGGHPTAGVLADYPAFAAIAGQFKLHNFSIVANTSRPRAMFLGNSLVYGYTLPTGTDWSHQLASQVGPSAVVSGRGGAKAQSALARIQSEVSVLKPDTLVIEICANDTLASCTSNLPQVIAQARPYVRNIELVVLAPSTGFNSDMLSINTLIKQQAVDGFLRFDLATSVNHDGVTQDNTLFNDTVHYDAAGTAAVLTRQPVDLPGLLD